MPINALAEPRRGQPEPDGVESMSEPISEAGRCVSEATYWRDYYPQSDIHYEWNNGHLEEKPVSDYETFLVYKWFLALLEHFLRTQPIAKLVGLEMGFRLPLPTGTVIRKPDLALVRNDNPRGPCCHGMRPIAGYSTSALRPSPTRNAAASNVTP